MALGDLNIFRDSCEKCNPVDFTALFSLTPRDGSISQADLRQPLAAAALRKSSVNSLVRTEQESWKNHEISASLGSQSAPRWVRRCRIRKASVQSFPSGLDHPKTQSYSSSPGVCGRTLQECLWIQHHPYPLPPPPHPPTPPSFQIISLLDTISGSSPDPSPTTSPGTITDYHASYASFK